MEENKNDTTRDYYDECWLLLTRLNNAISVIEITHSEITGAENLPYAQSISCALSELQNVYSALDTTIAEWNQNTRKE